MVVLQKNEEIKIFLNNEKNNGKIIGFVPTMGALHNGHLSLVEQCKLQADICVVSIFVNPTQFNDPEDFKRYPKRDKQDLEMLQQMNVDVVFMPTVEEMYPQKDMRIFSFGHLEKVMEGKFRPGHFNGVAQIVSKLFEIVEPHKAFFGLKDYQQYHIVKALVKRYMNNLNIEIIGCPIVREDDGLAMSSRNLLLSAEERKNAIVLYRTLEKVKEFLTNKSIEEVKEFAQKTINNEPNMKLEYFEIVDGNNLLPITDLSDSENVVACVAAYCGKIRLIDNMSIK